MGKSSSQPFLTIPPRPQSGGSRLRPGAPTVVSQSEPFLKSFHSSTSPQLPWVCPYCHLTTTQLQGPPFTVYNTQHPMPCDWSPLHFPELSLHLRRECPALWLCASLSLSTLKGPQKWLSALLQQDLHVLASICPPSQSLPLSSSPLGQGLVGPTHLSCKP